MKDLFAIEDNLCYLQELKLNRKGLIPFLGSGFSVPFCPTLGTFLINFFLCLKNDQSLTGEEIEKFVQIESDDHPDRLEKMTEFLFKKSPGSFKDEMKRQLSPTVPLDRVKKFHLLHQVFPYLKLTANYDRLIETTVPNGVYVNVFYGYEGDKLNGLFSRRHKQSCLLKIHGGIEDMDSIVLSHEQFRGLYGAQRDDVNAKLPYFLKKLFTHTTVLFIGCSMRRDPITMIMEDLPPISPHYAIMKMPDTGKEKILLQRQLSNQGINIIWVETYDQIEDILTFLAGKVTPAPEVSWTKMGSFVGREEQLARIATNLEMSSAGTGEGGEVQAITGRLYSIHGIGGVGKTALALEAARRFGDKFKDGVLPLFRADEHTPVSFALALATCLGVPLPEPKDAEAARQAVASLLKNRRCLVLLDNVEKWEDLRYMIPPQMSASVLVTTRNRDISRKISNHCPELRVEEIALGKFTQEETLLLFRKMLGSEYREEEVEIYLEIGRDLGFLPIALRQAITLMAYTPHYRAGELRDRLKSDNRLELLRRGYAEVESDSRVIETVFDLSVPVLTAELKEVLGMMAVCSPGPVPLDFLERLFRTKVFGAPETISQIPDLVEILERLYTYSWCERREVEGQRYYELHQLVREVVRAQAQENGGELPYLEEFIDLVHNIFTDKDVHFSVKERYIFQLEEAFAGAVERKDPRLKEDWLYNLYYFCIYRGYAHFYLRLTEAVERLFPGDRWTMRTVYAHRALILQDWGKLTEAMAMLQKQEAISEELGDRAGLTGTYGNQALILKAWGRLEEAMAMHKKEEAICVELGDRAGLSRSYGNQALILSDWGRLEEAMAMLQKQEAISEELGDRVGLAICWWNLGIIVGRQGDPKTHIDLWRKAIDTDKALNIPTVDGERALDKLLNEFTGKM